MKTLKTVTSLLLAATLLISISSCEEEEKNDNNTQTDALENFEILGTETISTNLEVTLYSERAPFVGCNNIALRLKDKATGNIISTADINYRPMMDMGMMQHSTPVQNPVYNTEMNAYNGWVTFIMPSSASGSWSFDVIVKYMGTKDTVSFAHEVIAPEEARVFSFVSMVDSSTSYFVALKEPMKPEMGLNDFELMIYKRESMMSFPPATNLRVEIEPEMPSMGHGSPNNENPTHIENGLYRGKVNFTMSGLWKVNIDILNESETLLNSEGAFNITF